MRIIRRSEFAATRWKNGGGITHEAIRVPAGGSRFRWRLSVAEIASCGPFSEFSDYSRCMVLLGGGGLRLRFASGGEIVLREVGDLAEFDGAEPADCDLRAGACTDLNLMTLKAITPVEARVMRPEAALALQRDVRETLVIFCVAGALDVTRHDGESSARAVLGPWDLAVLDGAAGSCIVRPTAGGGAQDAAFVAKFTDRCGI